MANVKRLTKNFSDGDITINPYRGRFGSYADSEIPIHYFTAWVDRRYAGDFWFGSRNITRKEMLENFKEYFAQHGYKYADPARQHQL